MTFVLLKESLGILAIFLYPFLHSLTTNMPLFILEVLPKILTTIALVLLLLLGYNHVKQIGYHEAEVVYQQKIQDYQDTVLTKVFKIENDSSVLVKMTMENNDALSKDVSTILTKVKGKPLVVVKGTDCTPSQNFNDALNEVNKRVNQSIKDSQK